MVQRIRTPHIRHPLPVGLAVALMMIPALVWAQDAAPAKVSDDTVSSVQPPDDAAAMPADPNEANAALYCRNIANAAVDARYARQSQALSALEKELNDRIAALQAKQAEYEQWVKRREDLLAKADENVVAIYSQMRPDAAAQQVAVMDPDAAAAILAKLAPRIASAILNEMDPLTAAQLTNVMAGAPSKDQAQAGG
jgi:flagellar motility protein MotE (MotC chaperone)